MAEQSWKHANNERVSKLMDALTRASAALQQAARYAADVSEGLTAEEPAYQIRTWALSTVTELEGQAKRARSLLV